MRDQLDLELTELSERIGGETPDRIVYPYVVATVKGRGGALEQTGGSPNSRHRAIHERRDPPIFARQKATSASRSVKRASGSSCLPSAMYRPMKYAPAVLQR